MKIEVSDDLKSLASLFTQHDKKLYIVGGFVRNSILNLKETDVDICGEILPDEVIKLSTKLGYRAQVVNSKLGTVLITTKNGNQYEYTTFRSESYVNGNHSPEEVEFVTDIKLDAKRRDFTCNALYYDIEEDKILDFYNGVSDINNKILKCVETPNYVFSSDGLRLLRLVRFASSLNFKIDKKTIIGAKTYIKNLLDITSERKIKELKAIAECDKKYGIKNAHVYAVKLFNKLNVWHYVFPNLKYNFKININNKDFNIYKNCNEDFRFVNLCALIITNLLKTKNASVANIEFWINNLFNTKSLRLSNKDLIQIKKILVIMFAFKNLKIANVVNLREIAISIKNEKIGECVKFINSKKYDVILNEIKNMEKQNIPFEIKDLAITSKEILDLNIVENYMLSKLYQELFIQCVFNNLKNSKEELVSYIIKNYKK